MPVNVVHVRGLLQSKKQVGLRVMTSRLMGIWIIWRIPLNGREAQRLWLVSTTTLDQASVEAVPLSEQPGSVIRNVQFLLS
jgi:hypothetical protein